MKKADFDQAGCTYYQFQHQFISLLVCSLPHAEALIGHINNLTTCQNLAELKCMADHMTKDFRTILMDPQRTGCDIQWEENN